MGAALLGEDRKKGTDYMGIDSTISLPSGICGLLLTVLALFPTIQSRGPGSTRFAWWGMNVMTASFSCLASSLSIPEGTMGPKTQLGGRRRKGCGSCAFFQGAVWGSACKLWSRKERSAPRRTHVSILGSKVNRLVLGACGGQLTRFGKARTVVDRISPSLVHRWRALNVISAFSFSGHSCPFMFPFLL